MGCAVLSYSEAFGFHVVVHLCSLLKLNRGFLDSVKKNFSFYYFILSTYEVEGRKWVSTFFLIRGQAQNPPPPPHTFLSAQEAGNQTGSVCFPEIVCFLSVQWNDCRISSVVHDLTLFSWSGFLQMIG